jgi:N-acetylglucosaminyl-diphospho-decaprenol L-rhamnosyltransferase
MHVAVCVVGYRNASDILKCLRALQTSTHSNFDIVICENGGPAAVSAVRSVAPPSLPGGQGILVLDAGGNPGFAAGINLCIQATPHVDAWWLLNPDTEPEPEALLRLCERLQRGDCAAVGCTIVTSSGEVESRGGRWRPWLARAVAIDQGRSLEVPATEGAREERINYLSGASMLVGREMLAVAGPMREDYFLYGEEVEWCLRAVQRGLRLGLALEAEVRHHQGATTGSVRRMAQRRRMPVYLDERNKLLLTRDRYPALLPVAAPAALLLAVLRFAKRGAWRQLGYALEGWVAGLRNERGKPEWLDDGGDVDSGSSRAVHPRQEDVLEPDFGREQRP